VIYKTRLKYHYFLGNSSVQQNWKGREKKMGIRKPVLITLLVSVHLGDLEKPSKESITYL